MNQHVSSGDKKNLRGLASNFFFNNDILYKINYDIYLLRCMDWHEVDMLIKEIHEGSFRTHANGNAMTKKILIVGYYWLTMENNYFKYVKKCHKCQIYIDKVHVPSTPLNVLSSPWPFCMWGIDVIGMIEPKDANDTNSYWSPSITSPSG